MKGKQYVVLLTCPERKKCYSFVFDGFQNMFYVTPVSADPSRKGLNCLKIGRDKLWSDIHIPDMFVSGRFCTIFFDGTGLCAEKNVLAKKENTENLKFSSIIKLENGGQFTIGKDLYNVIIKHKTY